jgi:hypothetical protein
MAGGGAQPPSPCTEAITQLFIEMSSPPMEEAAVSLPKDQRCAGDGRRAEPGGTGRRSRSVAGGILFRSATGSRSDGNGLRT